MITVGIADDEALVRAGIRGVLGHATDVKVVAEASDGSGAIELVRRHRPRVLLMDIRMRGMDGLSAAEGVRKLTPSTSVIMLTAMAVDEHVDRALRAGAAGFLVKDSNPRELINAVRAVAAGEAMLSPSVTRYLLDRIGVVDSERADRARQLLNLLTEREKSVLKLLAKGMGNLEIAHTLYVSESAVKSHVSRLLTKLRCGNRVQAAMIAHHGRLTD